jgi:hypothetical protein
MESPAPSRLSSIDVDLRLRKKPEGLSAHKLGQLPMKWYKRDPDAAIAGMSGLTLEESVAVDRAYRAAVCKAEREGGLPVTTWEVKAVSIENRVASIMASSRWATRSSAQPAPRARRAAKRTRLA